MLSIAFVWTFLDYILVLIANGIKFDGSKPYMEAFVGLGMLMPLIANILTRGITKEGFAMTGRDSLMLGINLKNRRWKYYVFAMFVPWLYFEIMHILASILVPASFQTDMLEELDVNKELVFAYLVFTIYHLLVSGIILVQTMWASHMSELS